MPTDPRDSEKAFSQRVVQLAEMLGWKVFRVFNSQFSPAGWPDLTLLRGDQIIWVELKMPGKWPSEAQLCWLRALQEIGDVFILYPDQIQEIAEVLTWKK